MVQPVVTRSQRRMERKQVVLIVVLILAVAGISFFVGVLVGQRNGCLPGFEADVESPKLPIATTIVPPPPPIADAASEKPEKLTFYDNLPKGNQAPLGSGINLPVEQKKPAAEQQKVRVPPPTATLTAEAASKPSTASAESADGAFVVQVASFRTNEDAEKMAGRLNNYKLTIYVESADLSEKGVWYRVMVGPFASRESAEQVAVLLQQKERLSALVRTR